MVAKRDIQIPDTACRVPTYADIYHLPNDTGDCRYESATTFDIYSHYCGGYFSDRVRVQSNFIYTLWRGGSSPISFTRAYIETQNHVVETLIAQTQTATAQAPTGTFMPAPSS